MPTGGAVTYAVLFALCAALIGRADAHLDPGTGDRAVVFPLLPHTPCEEAADRARCAVASPKPWSEDERRSIGDALQRIAGQELVRGIIVGALDNGYEGLRRYATDTEPAPGSGWEPKFSPGFVLYGAREVAVTDAYFLTADMTDAKSAYRFGDLILIHELAHAFDDRARSIDEGFTSLVGWTFKDGAWAYARRVGWSQYHGVLADTLTLYGRGRYRDAWTRDRAFATSLAYPLPTIQSLVNPAESFADMLAHLMLDSTARSYLDARVVAWFEQQVFPGLRDKARRFGDLHLTSPR